MVKLPKIPQRMFLASLMGTCAGIGFIVKDRFGGEKYPYLTDHARKKVVIITGANTGIGAAVAKELAYRKAIVILACRDMEKCQKVEAHLQLYMKNKNVKCMECDLSSQQSIRNFVEEFKEWYPRLDVLINNAGVYGVRYSKTSEGIETHLGVNHMGHFLLTNLLLPMIKESAPSRIVNLTSISYRKGTINKTDLNSDKEYDAEKAYNQSKLANLLFTKELARRLEGTGVTACAVFPGVVSTELMRHTDFYKSFLSTVILKPILWLFIKSPHRGAQSVVHAAIDPEVIAGQLYSDFKPLEIAPVGNDLQTAKWLWTVSEKWTRLIS